MSDQMVASVEKQRAGKSTIATQIFIVVVIAALGGIIYFQYQTIGRKTASITELTSQVAVSETERKSLQANLTDVGAMINEVAVKLHDVRKNQVAINELVTRSADEMTTRKDQMLSDIDAIEGQLVRDRQDIDALSERIRQSGVRIASLENVVASLRKEIAENTRTMADLRSIIEQKNEVIRQAETRLRETETSLATVRTELAGTRTELAETQQSLNQTRNTAFVAIGTRDDLKDLNIIDVQGLLWKRVDLSEKLDDKQFTRIDITRDNQFPLTCRAKDVRIVPDRNEACYLIEEANEGGAVLRITDPEQFWKIKYMAVVVKG